MLPWPRSNRSGTASRATGCRAARSSSPSVLMTAPPPEPRPCPGGTPRGVSLACRSAVLPAGGWWCTASVPPGGAKDRSRCRAAESCGGGPLGMVLLSPGTHRGDSEEPVGGAPAGGPGMHRASSRGGALGAAKLARAVRPRAAVRSGGREGEAGPTAGNDKGLVAPGESSRAGGGHSGDAGALSLLGLCGVLPAADVPAERCGGPRGLGSGLPWPCGLPCPDAASEAAVQLPPPLQYCPHPSSRCGCPVGACGGHAPAVLKPLSVERLLVAVLRPSLPSSSPPGVQAADETGAPACWQRRQAWLLGSSVVRDPGWPRDSIPVCCPALHGRQQQAAPARPVHEEDRAGVCEVCR